MYFTSHIRKERFSEGHMQKKMIIFCAAIVLPGTNHILRYDKEKDRYEFHEGE